MKGIFAVIAGFALIHGGGVQLAGGRDADRHQREQPDRFCRRADDADSNERENVDARLEDEPDLSDRSGVHAGTDAATGRTGRPGPMIADSFAILSWGSRRTRLD